MPRLVSIVLYALARILLVIVPFFILIWVGAGLVLSAVCALVIGVALAVIVLGRVQDPLVAWLQERGSATQRSTAEQRTTAAERDASIEDTAIDERVAHPTGQVEHRNGQTGDVTKT